MVTSISTRVTRVISKTIAGTLVVIQVFGGVTFAEAPRFRYLTIRGDTLSDIVWATVPGRLYGPGGNLERVVKLNPRLKNPDRILPGDVVLLPDGSKFLVEVQSEVPSEKISPNFTDEEEVRKRVSELKASGAAERRIASVEESPAPEVARAISEPAPVATADETEVRTQKPSPEQADIKILQQKIVAMEKLLEATKQVPAPKEVKPESTADAAPLPKSEYLRGAKLELSPFYRMNAITLTDPTNATKSTIGSKIYAGANINYAQLWTKKFQSYVHLNLGFISFEPPVDTTKTLDSSDHLMSGMGVGARYRLLNSFEFDFLAAYQKELFGRSASTTSVAIDSVSVPSLRLQANWDLVNLDPFVFGIAPIYQLYFSTQVQSYPVRQGKAMGGILYFKQSVRGNEPDFQTEVGILSRTQNSVQIEQNELSLFLNLRFFFDIGRKQKAREVKE